MFTTLSCSLATALYCCSNHADSSNAHSLDSGHHVVKKLYASCLICAILDCEYLPASAYSHSLTTDVGSSTLAKSDINACLSCAVAVLFFSLDTIPLNAVILDDIVLYAL